MNNNMNSNNCQIGTIVNESPEKILDLCEDMLQNHFNARMKDLEVNGWNGMDTDGDIKTSDIPSNGIFRTIVLTD